jgi:hypothetical protein
MPKGLGTRSAQPVFCTGVEWLANLLDSIRVIDGNFPATIPLSYSHLSAATGSRRTARRAGT